MAWISYRLFSLGVMTVGLVTLWLTGSSVIRWRTTGELDVSSPSLYVLGALVGITFILIALNGLLTRRRRRRPTKLERLKAAAPYN